MRRDVLLFAVDHARTDVAKGNGLTLLSLEDAQDVELLGGDAVGLQQRPVAAEHGAGGVQHRQGKLLLRRGKLSHVEGLGVFMLQMYTH